MTTGRFLARPGEEALSIHQCRLFAHWELFPDSRPKNPPIRRQTRERIFSSPEELPDGSESARSDPPGEYLYAPVRRRDGQHTFPAVRLVLEVWQVGLHMSLTNAFDAQLEGKTIRCEVVNVFRQTMVQYVSPRNEQYNPYTFTPLYYQGDTLNRSYEERVLHPKKGGLRLPRYGRGDAPMNFEARFENSRAVIEFSGDAVAQWMRPGGNAQVNQNCFVIRVKAGDALGELRVVSRNKLVFYQRKTLVFLPGIFGSSVELQRGDGRVDGYPNYFNAELFKSSRSADAGRGFLERFSPSFALARRFGKMLFEQPTGRLACDSDGKALLDAAHVAVLERAFGTSVYSCAKSIANALEEILPRFLRDVIWMVEAPYDWRLDLSETAGRLARDVDMLHNILRELDDTDDQVSLAGHSTGGLVLRRALGAGDAAFESLPATQGLSRCMHDMVAHAFFLNVPFRGAPKVISTMITGRDPPGGGPMLPMFSPEGLRAIAHCAPVVYHLAPSRRYPYAVASTQPPMLREGDVCLQREDIVRLAGLFHINAGHHLVDPAYTKTQQQRIQIADGGDAWHRHEAERMLYEHKKHAVTYAIDVGGGLHVIDQASQREIARLDQTWQTRDAQPLIASQRRVRQRFDYNHKLQARAAHFHEISESIAKSGKFADKAYIFYSRYPSMPIDDALPKSEKEEKWLRNQAYLHSTTGKIRLRKLGSQQKRLLECLTLPSTTVTVRRGSFTHILKQKWNDLARRFDKSGEKPILEEGEYVSPLRMTHVYLRGDGVRRRVAEHNDPTDPTAPTLETTIALEEWELAAVMVQGDGTVPLTSQLGFGGTAKVFIPIPGGPDHVAAPNDPFVWQRMFEVMLGMDVSECLLRNDQIDTQSVGHDGLHQG